jgi:NETI protein
MDKKPSKKKFAVETGESLSDCLDRMAKEGYTPVRRMEEPVFHEVKRNGRLEPEVKEQRIIFEGKLIK